MYRFNRSDRYNILQKRKRKAYFKIETRYCQGCGKKTNLSRSHTLSVKKHPDLIDHPDNIFVLCMDRCHPKIEQSRFHEIWCGEEAIKKAINLNWSGGVSRFYKMLQIIEDENSEMPEWVKELNEFISRMPKP